MGQECIECMRDLVRVELSLPFARLRRKSHAVWQLSQQCRVTGNFCKARSHGVIHLLWEIIHRAEVDCCPHIPYSRKLDAVEDSWNIVRQFTWALALTTGWLTISMGHERCHGLTHVVASAFSGSRMAQLKDDSRSTEGQSRRNWP